MDLILTGRPVEADEALAIGLANRLVPEGHARAAAAELAAQLAEFPQACMRSDRASALTQWDDPDPIGTEFTHGMSVLTEAAAGVTRFASGAGRHGAFG
jgi:enoyl-CoA hydratase